MKVGHSCPTLCNSFQFSRPEYQSGFLFPSPGDLSNPAIEPRSPALQVDSLPAEPRRKPKNTGVGSLSLFQQIFLTQESNWGLLHCRQILYQLSYEGSFILLPLNLFLNHLRFWYHYVWHFLLNFIFRLFTVDTYKCIWFFSLSTLYAATLLNLLLSSDSLLVDSLALSL